MSILDQADALRAKRRRALSLLDEYANALFSSTSTTATQKASLRSCGVRFSSGKSVVASGVKGHSMNRVLKVNSVSAESSGAAGVRNISQQKVLDFKADIPPKGSQLEIAELIDSAVSVRRLQEAAHAQLDELFASLQSRAFKGEL